MIGCPHRFIAARTHVASISIIVLNALALSRSWRRPGFKIHRPTGQPLEIQLGPSFGSSRHCLSWLSLQCYQERCHNTKLTENYRTGWSTVLVAHATLMSYLIAAPCTLGNEPSQPVPAWEESYQKQLGYIGNDT